MTNASYSLQIPRLAKVKTVFCLKADELYAPICLVHWKAHLIQGTVVFPGAAYAEMGLAAAKEIYQDSVSILTVDHVEFHKALFIPESERFGQSACLKRSASSPVVHY